MIRRLFVVVGVLVLALSAVSAAAAEPAELDTVFVDRYTARVFASDGPTRIAYDSAKMTACVQRYTGQVLALRYGCPASSVYFTLPEDGTVCVNRYTSQVRYTSRGVCSPVELLATL